MPTKQKLPTADKARGLTMSRGHMLDGTVHTYFSYDQSPLVIARYIPPNDWLTAGRLLRPPTTVWLSLNMGPIAPIRNDLSTVSEGGNLPIYTKYTYSPTTHGGSGINVKTGDLDAQGVPSDFPRDGTPYVTWDGVNIRETTTTTHYDDGGTVSIDPTIVQEASTTYSEHPLQAKYLALREAMLDLVMQIPTLTGGAVHAVFVDYTVLQLDDEPLGGGREFYSGFEALSDQGDRLADFSSFGNPNDLTTLPDGHYWLNELVCPIDNKKFYGSEFLHIFAGIPSGPGGDFFPGSLLTEGQGDATGRIYFSNIQFALPQFASYVCRLIGLEAWERINYAFGTATGTAPVLQVVQDFPTLVASVINPLTATIGAIGPDSIVVTYTGTDDFEVYINRQFSSQAVADAVYADELTAYNALVALTAIPGYPQNSDASNAVLQDEALILASSDFAYLGDTSAVSFAEIRDLVMLAIKDKLVAGS